MNINLSFFRNWAGKDSAFLRSGVKALVGFAALLLAGLFGFSVWGILVFLAASGWIYWSESVERTARRPYFWLLAVWAVVAGAISSGVVFYLAGLAYAAMLYSWLGDIRLMWPNRAAVAGIGETGLFAACAVVIFALFPGIRTMPLFGDVGFVAAVFAVAVILIREVFGGVNGAFRRREMVFAWGGGIILAETAALLVFLPLGFLNAAAALTLAFVVLRDVFTAHFRGLIKTGFVFREITVVVVFLVLIFAVVPWALQ